MLFLGIPIIILAFTFGYLMFFVQELFIFKRYEEDTNLSETEPLFKVLSFIMDSKAIRAVLYTTHLFMVILTDRGIIKRRGHLKNTPTKEMLTHFSEKECTYTVVTIGCGALCMALAIVFHILNRMWK